MEFGTDSRFFGVKGEKVFHPGLFINLSGKSQEKCPSFALDRPKSW